MQTNSRTKIGWIAGIVAVWLAGLCGTASAALIAYEGFNYTAAQTVGGLNGGSGWTSVWQGDAAGTTTTISGGTASITTPGSTNAGLQVSGNAATITPTNALTGAWRSFPAVNSGTVYFSMLETRLNSGARHLGMALYNTTNEYPFFGKNSGQTNWSMSATPDTYVSGSSAATNVPALLVLRVDFNVVGTGSAYERQRLYVNPTPGTPEPVTAAADSVATTTYNIPQLDRVFIAAGYSNATFTTTSIGTLDELRIGTTWADVVPLAPVDFSSWAKKVSIQFTGYTRSETLTNFPALVTLSTSIPGFSYADFLSTNADLRFTDSTQTSQLNYEIEKWDTNGTSYVWVQVPQLTSGASIYAFWGKSGQTVPDYTTNGATWASDYGAVWHLNDTGPTNRDSAGFNNALTNSGAVAYTNAGLTGGSMNFGGGTSAMRTADHDELDGMGASLTLEGWAYRANATMNNGYNVISKRTAPGSEVSYNMFVDTDQRLWSDINNGTAGSGRTNSTFATAANRWQYLAVTFRSNDLRRFYIDGQNAGTVTETQTTVSNTLSLFSIGQLGGNNNSSWQGLLDEVRVSSVARSSNWVWACYMNQASNSLFATSAGVAGVPSISTDPVTNLTATSATLQGTLSSTGTSATAVFVYYGPTDGGANAANWAATNASLVAPQSVGAKSVTVSLNPGWTYSYRYAASNAAGVAWAGSSQSFTTPVDYNAWAKRLQLQFPGYTRSETLTNFPALVVLSTNISGFAYTDFLSGSNADLRFTDATLTNQLNYEVEKWDPSGNSYVWVQVPQLTSGASIYAFWGKSGQDVPAYTTNGATWSSGFSGVYHFRQTNSAPDLRDSSANAYHGLNSNTTSTAAGLVGDAENFPGINQFITLTDASKYLPTTNTPITVAAWFKANAISSSNLENRIVTFPRSSGSSGFTVSLGLTNKLQFVHVNTSGTGLAIDFATVASNNWYHTTVAFNGSQFACYLNGSLLTNVTDSLTNSDTTGKAYIGGGPVGNGANVFNGTMDEIELSSVARSSNWVWACYLNQASNGVFLSNSGVAASSLAQIRSDAPTGVTSTSASLNGTLMAGSTNDTAVLLYYGPTDGGTNTGSWGASTNMAAPQALGAKSVSLPLPAGGETFYRFAASNALGLVWADSSQYLLTTNVAISVSPATVGEMNALGTFSFVRPAALTNGALTVNFTLGGVASNGVDYTLISATSVTIPRGVASNTLTVTTLPDGVVEGAGSEALDLVEIAGAYVLNAPPTTTLTVADSPALTTLPASGISASHATLNGSLGGASDASVFVYYGPTDGGTNKGSWGASTNLPAPQATGAKSITGVGPFDTGRPYFYRFAASNASSFVWATNSQAFTTLVDFGSWPKGAQIGFPGYTRNETLTNFPALVVLGPTISGFRYADFLSGANADLRFTDATRTNQLNYEIEKWDTNGNSYVWVQVPLLSSNASIWAYWGKSGQTAPAYTTNGATWESGFKGVWHLDETAFPYSDATSNRIHGASGTAPAAATGLIGGGQLFTSTSSQFIDLSSNVFPDTSFFTIAAWVKPVGGGTAVGRGRDGDPTGWSLSLGARTGAVHTATVITMSGGAAGYSAGGMTTIGSSNRWDYLTAVWRPQNGGLTFYVNGVQEGTNATTTYTLRDSTVGVRFGRVNDTYYSGALDEVQISNIARSSNWVWACYMNQASNSVFLSVNTFPRGSVFKFR